MTAQDGRRTWSPLMPQLSLISSLYLYGVIGSFVVFAVTLFVVSLITNLKR